MVAFGLVALDRVAGGPAPWPLLVFVPIGAFLAYAVARSVLSRPTPIEAAVEVDRSLGLKDKISSAMTLASGPGAGGEFVAWAVRDAEEAARAVELSRVMPLKADWTWAAWPLVSAACIAGALFVPAMDWSRRGAPMPVRAASEEQATQLVAEAVREARETIGASPGDVATAAELRTLEELQRELTTGKADPDSAITKAASELDGIAERMEAAAAQREREIDGLKSRLAAAGGDEGATPGEESALSEALKRGDLQAASEAARTAADDAETWTPERREEFARELERLAEKLKEKEASEAPGEQAPADPKRLSEQTEQDLRDQGVDPDVARKLAERTTEREIREELEQSGVEPEAARRLAERIAEENREREAEQGAEERSKELARSLEDAARELREPAGGKDEPPGDQKPPGDQEPPKGQQPPTGQEPPDGREQPQGQEPSGQQGAEPGKRPESGQPKGSEQGKGEEPAPSGQQPGEQKPGTEPGQQPGEQKPGTEPGQQPGAQPDQGTKPGGQQPPAEGGTREPGQEPGATGNEQRGREPGTEPGSEERTGTGNENQEGGEGAGADPDAKGMKGLKRTIERIAESERDPAKRRETAEKLRRQAQDLYDKATPEERESLRRWAEAAGKEQGRPGAGAGPRAEFRQEPVDARRSPDERAKDAERVVAQWFSDQPAERDGRTGRSPMEEALQEATQGAERAIEQQVVPDRYSELVRRVFRRYGQRTESPGGSP